MRSTRALLITVVVVSFVALGCSDDDDDDTTTTTEPAAATETTVPPTTDAPPAPDAPPRPASGTCDVIPEAADGRYTVADAGTAVVTREGDRLVIGEVQPAPGWTHRVQLEEPAAIEIEFRDNGTELELEVDIDDGRVEVEICADD